MKDALIRVGFKTGMEYQPAHHLLSIIEVNRAAPTGCPIPMGPASERVCASSSVLADVSIGTGDQVLVHVHAEVIDGTTALGG